MINATKYRMSTVKSIKKLMFKKSMSVFLLFLITLSGIQAQKVNQDSASQAFSIGIAASYCIPGQDMAVRFGNNAGIGGSAMFKTKKNWLFGLEGQYLFGNNVKEDYIFSNIETEKGQIIDGDGIYADISLSETGFLSLAKFGKIIPIAKSNPNSGLLLIVGSGFLQHKIKIEVENKTVHQLRDDYLKGYDRLSNGLALSQLVGYWYMSKSKIANFYAGIELIEAFTENRRDYDFYLKKKFNDKRTDILSGFKLVWFIPWQKRASNKYYYY